MKNSQLVQSTFAEEQSKLEEIIEEKLDYTLIKIVCLPPFRLEFCFLCASVHVVDNDATGVEEQAREEQANSPRVRLVKKPTSKRDAKHTRKGRHKVRGTREDGCVPRGDVLVVAVQTCKRKGLEPDPHW